MKSPLTLSALAAVVIATATYASADTITLVSNSTTVNYGGYSPTVADVAPTIGALPTFNIGTGGVWTAPTGGSSWVSWDSGSGPGGGHINPNGDYSYSSTFTMALTDTTFSGTLTVMADDTTNVWLNGVELVHAGVIGGNLKCADGTPNCITPVTFSLTGIHAGLNTLSFDVEQTGLASQGLDFSGSVTGTGPVPEPSTLLMLGTGLLGSAGAMFRRMRK